MDARLSHPAAGGVPALAITASTPMAAQAQAAADGWQSDATVYFWLPTVGGQTSFPAGSGGSSVDVTADKVFDALKFALMGSVGARKGSWGVWTDLACADFGATQEGSRDFTIGHRPLPAGVDGKLDLDLKVTGWTLAGTYALAAIPMHQVDLLAGARLLDVELKLDWSVNADISGTSLPGRNGASSASLDNWDAIVGIQGRAVLDRAGQWFVPYDLDVGTGESDFTWQAHAGLGYRFAWGSAAATYRHLDHEMKSGRALQW